MNVFKPICEEAAMVNDEVVSMVLDSLWKLKSDVRQCSKQKLAQTVPLMYPEDNGPPFQPTFDDNGTTTTLQQPIDVGVKDPVPKHRGRGRPKGSRNKGLAEIGYKKPWQKKVQANPCLDNGDTGGGDEAVSTNKPKKMSVGYTLWPYMFFSHSI